MTQTTIQSGLVSLSTQKIYITRGLPASGKTTWAKEQTAQSYQNDKRTIKRINNDDIRIDLYGKPGTYQWKPELEKEVQKYLYDELESKLIRGFSVIVDNTYLNSKTLKTLQDWLKQKFPQLDVVLVDFTDVPVDICIERDRERKLKGENSVGDDVIWNMAKKAGLLPKPIEYPVDPNLPWCMISDLDGTLAIFHDRRNAYNASNCHIVDEPNPAVLGVIKTYYSCYLDLYEGYVNKFAKPNIQKCFFFSGRTDKYIEPTKKFLTNKCNIDLTDSYFELVMRQDSDHRKDSELKMEMFDKHIRGKYNVAFCMDDRPQVCNGVWRKLGVPLFQVGRGDKYEF